MFTDYGGWVWASADSPDPLWEPSWELPYVTLLIHVCICIFMIVMMELGVFCISAVAITQWLMCTCDGEVGDAELK